MTKPYSSTYYAYESSLQTFYLKNNSMNLTNQTSIHDYALQRDDDP